MIACFDNKKADNKHRRRAEMENRADKKRMPQHISQRIMLLYHYKPSKIISIYTPFTEQAVVKGKDSKKSTRKQLNICESTDRGESGENWYDEDDDGGGGVV